MRQFRAAFSLPAARRTPNREIVPRAPSTSVHVSWKVRCDGWRIEKTRTEGTCCGDSYFGMLPDDQLKELMAERASQIPAEDVVVYCVSCAKAMHIGGKRPRYMVDLLFGEDTPPRTFEPSEWHAQLDEFIEKH